MARQLYETRTIEAVHAMDEAVFFDEFFHYLREIGAWPLLEQLDPEGRQGSLYTFIQFVMVVLDCPDDEATPSYKTDDGRPVPHVTGEKRPDVRANRHAKKVEVTVYGWKLWVVWEPQMKMPLALAIDDIQVHDNQHAYEVLAQAQQNVAGIARIRSVALDRGFLDGKLLSRIEKDGILIYIPAKANMRVAQDAREIARRAWEEGQRGRSLEGCVVRERHEKVRHGSGKKAPTEILTTTLVGVRELGCDWWNEDGSNSKENSKSYEPKLLNATVVLRWDGAAKEAEHEVVILTTNPAQDPFEAFDGYDDRSLIENTCNREAKEQWFLEHHPKRSEAGVRVHAYSVFMCMALVVGFRVHRSNSDRARLRGQETGIARYRRELRTNNWDKVMVFTEEHFGIFRNYEFALLGGLSVLRNERKGESLAVVLERYGVPAQRADSS